MQWARKQNGFTIVELLIVVVVIAILASITVVAYNGIQDRALNTSRISAARSAVTLLSLYATEHGRYPELPSHPIATGIRAACIGTGWPTMQGQAVCWNIYTDDGALTNSTFLEYATVNTSLKEIGSLPQYPQKPARSSMTQSSTGRPLSINALILAEQLVAGSPYFPEGYSIAYVLSGSPDAVECGVGGAIKTAFSGANEANITRCVVPLPTPSS